MAKDIFSLHDFELVDRAIQGDNSAFTKIVNRHQSLVASTAVNMLGDMEEATEIGQQVFIRFYKSMDKFKKEAKLSTYLTRITINLCLNHLKRNKTFLSRKIDLSVAQHKTTDDFSRAMENKEIVNRALQKLETDHRIIVTLRMIQGYSTQETADMLNIPKGTVLSRLKRAMDKLKIILKNELQYEH